MAPTPYFGSVLSEATFRARYKAENGKPFSELENVAASNWGRAHLLACRVVRRESQDNLLPILSQYVTTSDFLSSSDEIKEFLRGPDLTLMAQSEHYLVRRSGCGITLAQIWAAVAMFKGSQDRRIVEVPSMQEENGRELDNIAEARQPKRLRRNTFQPDFINSSGIQVGSSSPPHDGSYGGSQGSSLGYVDIDTHNLGITPEDDTVRLASCVIRHILYYASPQDLALTPIVVEFRDAKKRLAATTLVGARQIVAIDDGGLFLRRQKPDGGFVLANNHVAILEAKTQFQCIENGHPIISDRCFAQMVCEALATRLSDMSESSQQSVIVINATQHYMCFLQMDLTDDYLLDFESTTPTKMLYVSSTPWFDLSQKGGRKNVLANLSGIMHRAISE